MFVYLFTKKEEKKKDDNNITQSYVIDCIIAIMLYFGSGFTPVISYLIIKIR